MNSLITKRFIVKDLILPILVWIGLIFVFLNVKNIPLELSDKDNLVLRYFVKFAATIVFPLLLIKLLYKDKSDFGIYFPKLSDSFKLSLKTYTIAGPAGVAFLLIAWVGWSFEDWLGSATLSIFYLIVLYFIPRITKNLPTRAAIITPNNTIFAYIGLGLLTVIIAYLTYDAMPIISKILYFMFIVGLGEELLFRGYLQSAFNRYFGKPYRIGEVKFGLGLFLGALLFGLMHALVVSPPLWPWALFTFIIGLSLGFVREKDGSILSAVILHAMLDMPLIFFSA